MGPNYSNPVCEEKDQMPLSLEADYHHQGNIDLPENSCSSQSVHKAATGVMAGARKHEENTCRCSSTLHLRERQRRRKQTPGLPGPRHAVTKLHSSKTPSITVYSLQCEDIKGQRQAETSLMSPPGAEAEDDQQSRLK